MVYATKVYASAGTFGGKTLCFRFVLSSVRPLTLIHRDALSLYL